MQIKPIQSKQTEAGFTLLEMLIAVAIMATALVAYTSRLGISADIQRGLAAHTRMLETAETILYRQGQQAGPVLQEKSGVIEEEGKRPLSWRTWAEKTELKGFVRQNVEVSMEGEPPVSLFLFRAI